MNILAYPGPSASRHFRLDPIGKYIERNSRNSFYVSLDKMNENDLGVADVVILQQTIAPDKIRMAKEHCDKHGKLLVAELDDFFGINKENPYYERHQKTEAAKWLETLCGVADLVTTTTETLAKVISDALRANNVEKDIAVLPNYLDMEVWDRPKPQHYSDEIRLMWAGGASHREDIKSIAPVIRRLAGEYKNLKFVFCGDDFTKLFEGINYEHIYGVEFEVWPGKLHSIQGDIAIAPLLDNEFNRCKSNLKYLEYSIAKMPGVYSSVVYEKTVKDGVTGMIAHDNEEFYQKIKLLIDRPDKRDQIKTRAYLDVRNNYSLANHWHEWLDTYWYHLSKKRKLKIDVGSGIQPIMGANYVHLDVNPRFGEMVNDATKGIPVADESIERLRCAAILEHFYPHDLEKKVLPEFYRILEPGGTIHVLVPDWKKIKKSDNWEDIQTNLYGLYHEYIPTQFDIHKYCFDLVHLREMFKKAGFSSVKGVKCDTKAHDPRYTLAAEVTK